MRTRVGSGIRAAVEALEQRRLLSVSLPRDVNAVGPLVLPGNLTDVNGTVFFTTNDGVAGVELWKTDGTEAGTLLVKDVRPGSSTSAPANLLNLGGTLLFTANDGTSGVELWRSDGTAAGTTLVKDISEGAASSTPFGLVRVGSVAFFFARAGSSAAGGSVELWKTDGSGAGTTKVTDFAGPSGWAAASPVAAGGLLYFTVGNTATAQLWVSDGTAGGTQMLQVYTLAAGESVSGLTEFNGMLYFSAPDAVAGQEPWKSDGTRPGTVRVADAAAGVAGSAPRNFTAAGDKLFFTATTAATGLELMTFDTSDRLTLIDIRPGNAGSTLLDFAALNGKLYFSTFQNTTGYELWSSDGTAGGTAIVEDFRPGPLYGYGDHLTAANGRLYFYGSDATRTGLWSSDGTAGGASFLGTFAHRFHVPQGFTASGGKVFFTAGDGTSDVEVWVTDGFPNGPTLTRDINLFSNSADPRFIGTLGNSLYYFAKDGILGDEIQEFDEVWKTDGTPNGTTKLVDLNGIIYPEPSSAPPRGHTAGGYLYFRTSIDRPFPQSDNQVWRTDGTAAGTIEIHARGVRSWASAGNILYFINSESEVWRSDGTPGGTVRVQTFESSPAPLLGPSINGVVYLRASTFAGGEAVWRTNGPSAPLTRVTNGLSRLIGLSAVGDSLLFFATDRGDNKLYKTDGTPGNWTLVKDIRPDFEDYYEGSGIGVSGNRLYFDGGRDELWTSDGTPEGTYRVTDAGGTSPPNPSNIIRLNDTEVVFTTLGGNLGLWKSDGTSAGTVQLGDIQPWFSSPFSRSEFVRLGDVVYLPASNPPHGPSGMWRTDGTPQGTYMVSNLVPGQLAAVNGSVLFTADDKVRGLEVWRYVPEPPLRVTEAQFNHNGAAPAPHRLTFRLSAAAAALPQPGELSLLNLTTNTPVPAANFVRTYDAAARTVTFTFPGLPDGALPNGNYRALLPAGALTDAAGNALGLDHTVEFFVLHGDINRDRRVDSTDFATLAGNFGKTGMTYGQGDLNGDGRVDSSDFALLAGNFGRTVPAPVAPAPVAAAPVAVVAATPAPAARRRVRPTLQRVQPATPKAARRVPSRNGSAPQSVRAGARRTV